MRILLFFLPFMLFADQISDMTAKVNQAVEAFQKKHNIPGLSVGIISPLESGSYEKILTYGYTDRQSKISIKEETAFRIGRLTETFTATVVADLVKKGKINFTDSVESALPKGTKLPIKMGEKVTLNHLLHHCSGFPKEITAAFNRKEASKGGLINYITHLSLVHKPGSTSSLSDTDYALLSLVISHLHNDTYYRIMSDGFLQEIGYPETKFELSFHDAQRAAIGHRGFKIEPILGDKVWSPYAASRGLYSRPTEVMRWLKMHLEGNSRVKPLHAILQTSDLFGEKENAMGWEVVPLSNELQLKTYQVVDSYLGFSVYCAFMPSMQRGVFILSNTDESVLPLGKDLFKLLTRSSG